jgi:helicase
VKKRDFWNICGRAGRAGKETEGQVVFVVISPEDETLLQEFTNYENLEEINSALFKLLQALVERRISQDDLVGYLDSHILALLAEEVVDTKDEAAIKNWLGTSLVGVQALRRGIDLTPLASAIRSASAWVVNQVADAPLRQVFASTGFRVKSCIDLEKAVDQFMKTMTTEFLTEFLASEKDNLQPNEELLQAAFRACQYLPEMQRRSTISYCGPADEFEIVKDWITGKPISDLRSDSWDPSQGDSFSEYLADRVIYKLPWGLNGFLRILAFKLQKKYEELPMAWQHLPCNGKIRREQRSGVLGKQPGRLIPGTCTQTGRQVQGIPGRKTSHDKPPFLF